jgi:hypothetical protein
MKFVAMEMTSGLASLLTAKSHSTLELLTVRMCTRSVIECCFRLLGYRKIEISVEDELLKSGNYSFRKSAKRVR